MQKELRSKITKIGIWQVREMIWRFFMARRFCAKVTISGQLEGRGIPTSIRSAAEDFAKKGSKLAAFWLPVS